MRGNQAMIDEVLSNKNDCMDSVQDMLERLISAGGKLAGSASHQSQGATNEDLLVAKKTEMMESMNGRAIDEGRDRYESAKEQANVLMGMLPDLPPPSWLMEEAQDTGDKMNVTEDLAVTLQILGKMAMTGPFSSR
jgi:hypothetical protein